MARFSAKSWGGGGVGIVRDGPSALLEDEDEAGA